VSVQQFFFSSSFKRLVEPVWSEGDGWLSGWSPCVMSGGDDARCLSRTTASRADILHAKSD
jgi:hypothetical protein